MTFHVDVFAIDFDERSFTVVARLILGEPPEVLLESIDDERWSARLLVELQDGFGGWVSATEDPRLFFHRFGSWSLPRWDNEDVTYIAWGPHTAAACTARLGVPEPTDLAPMPERRASPLDKDMVCTFCGKRRDQVEKLIQGPAVRICDECVELCVEILDEEIPNWGSRSP